MATVDEVIVDFEARVGRYEADLRRAASTFERVTRQQQQQIERLERQIERSTSNMGSSLKGLAGALAGAFSAQQVTSLIDQYTRLQNSLKVAGLEGEQLLDVQARLLDLGGKYGVNINTLADLYGNLSQVSEELGANQTQILKINEAVAQSLLITGKSSAQAEGAVLGLVQAFGNGKLQAEEWAQINEGGLRPLLMAAAASEKYKGSVQNLRKAVYDGKVSSQEFFEAILDGSGKIEAKASAAAMTIEGAYQALNNRLIEYVGSTASAYGATGAIAKGIELLAENLDKVANAVATIAVILGVKYTLAAGAATAATVAKAAADVRATLTAAALASATGQANIALLGQRAAAELAAASVSRLAVAQGLAARAGSGALALMGGPWTAAALALGAAIYYVATQSTEAEAAAEAFARGQQYAADQTQNAADAATKLALAHGKARVEALALARAEAENIKQKIASAKASLALARVEAARQLQNRPSSKAPAGSFQGVVARGTRAISDTLFPSQAKPPAARLEDEIKGRIDGYEKRLDSLETEINAVETPRVSAVGDGKKDKKKPGGSGASKSDIASRFEDEMSRLRQEELQAQIDISTDANDRATLSYELLAEEFAQRKRQIENESDYTKAQKAAQIAELKKLYGVGGLDENGNIVVDGNAGLLGKAVFRDLEREQRDLRDALLQDQASTVESLAGIERNTAERYRFERELLRITQEIEANRLEEEIASGRVADAVSARANLERRNLAQTERLRRDQLSPLGRYSEDLADNATNTAERTEMLVVDELNYVRDGISSALAKRLGTKDPLITGLLTMFVEQVLMRPIAEALAKASASGGGGLGSIVSAIGSLFGGSPTGKAIGGPVSAGRAYKVGESGTELFRPQQNGVIIPNHSLSAPGQAQQVTVVVQANDYFDAHVAGISRRTATPIAKAEAKRSAGASFAMGQQSTPATLNKYSQLKD